MDNLCHTLCGLALARLCRTDPRGTALLLLAANAPDLDIAAHLFGGKPAYLIQHRGITHALPGIFVEALLIATAFRWIGRPTKSRFPQLAGLALLGLLSHFGLDALTSYGIRPWLPFSARWSYGDVAFIIDPWLWAMFATAAMLGVPDPGGGTATARRSGNKAWAGYLLGSAVSLAGIVAWSGRTSHVVSVTYASLCALAFSMRVDRISVPRGRRTAAVVMSMVVVYLTVLATLGSLAKERAIGAVAARLGGPGPIATTAIMPAPGVPWRFLCLVGIPGAVCPVRVDVLSGEIVEELPLRTRLDEPLLQRIQLTQEFRAWRVFSRLPYADYGGGKVTLGDARYPGNGFCTFDVGVGEESGR